VSTTTDETTTALTSAPEQSERRRRLIGLLAGVLAGAAVFLLLPAELTPSARFVAGTAVLMAIWWMTEALPLPATALIPLVAFPFLTDAASDDPDARIGIATAAAPYANPIIFLFMGGFAIGLAMQRWNLHRRFALNVVSRAGTNPVMIIGGFMLATAFISMWVSNTATAIMMLPVGVAVLALVSKNGDTDKNFATALMLGIAYAASIGSVGTLIGTPPNALLKGFLEQNYGISIGFAQWMAVGVPIAVVFLVIAWLVLTKLVFRPGISEVSGGRELIGGELRRMGGISRPELTVAVVFIGAALSWVVVGVFGQNEDFVAANPWFAYIDDAGIAVTAAIVLFLVPVSADGTRALDWDTMRDLPWGILLLFGGGLALSAQFTQTGLSPWIGERVEFLSGLPVWVIVLIVITLVIVLTELTSNTATTNAFLPVMAGVAMGLDIELLMLLVPTALVASMAFMLPVATPPNAIVFGSGRVRIADMVRGGVLLNVVGIVLAMVATYTLVSWVLL
jgi:solute carrier family 13 (sodium-dependent dicarboxylate transporter), member 2/3/5